MLACGCNRAIIVSVLLVTTFIAWSFSQDSNRMIYVVVSW